MMTIDPYETKVLNRVAHERLVADLPRIAGDAQIEQQWLWTGLKGSVSDLEFKWVEKFKYHRVHGVYGLCVTGKGKIDPTTRMSAIAGALLRNFIRVRVCSIGEVIEEREAGHRERVTCLLIPNFFLGKNQGSSLPAWKLTHLIDVLVERRLAGLQTVIYVSDMNALSEEYGQGFAQHIKSYFTNCPA